MITLEDAWHRQGYTRDDHLLDDGPLKDMIGRQFRSVGEARKALAAVSLRTQTRGCRLAPIGLVVRLASGDRKEL